MDAASLTETLCATAESIEGRVRRHSRRLGAFRPLSAASFEV